MKFCFTSILLVLATIVFAAEYGTVQEPSYSTTFATPPVPTVEEHNPMAQAKEPTTKTNRSFNKATVQVPSYMHTSPSSTFNSFSQSISQWLNKMGSRHASGGMGGLNGGTTGLRRSTNNNDVGSFVRATAIVANDGTGNPDPGEPGEDEEVPIGDVPVALIVLLFACFICKNLRKNKLNKTSLS